MTDLSASRSLAWSLLRLARPHQWAKGVFVMLGPLYHLADEPDTTWDLAWGTVVLPALLAACVFGLASSAGYVVNDIRDASRDRLHPRKCRRPIASGAVSAGQGLVFAAVLLAGAVALLFALDASVRWWVALCVAVYLLNVNLYSFGLKRVVVADVMCLAIGFVIRVIGGCAATYPAGVYPSTWILICTFFLAMFLAFGKRLGERRVMGDADAATSARAVQSAYTDEMLRMFVVVTAVGVLFTYAVYTQNQEQRFLVGFNLLWLTMIPATYAMLRCIVLVERGEYDDPTELALHDRAFQLAAAVFAALTVFAVVVAGLSA